MILRAVGDHACRSTWCLPRTVGAKGEALVAIFGHAELAKQLAFRGGTELQKLHIRPAARYEPGTWTQPHAATRWQGPSVAVCRANLRRERSGKHRIRLHLPAVSKKGAAQIEGARQSALAPVDRVHPHSAHAFEVHPGRFWWSLARQRNADGCRLQYVQERATRVRTRKG